jgi:hypothetical protein
MQSARFSIALIGVLAWDAGDDWPGRTPHDSNERPPVAGKFKRKDSLSLKFVTATPNRWLRV